MKIHQHLDLKFQFRFLICLALLLCLGQTYGDSATISFNWAQTVRVSQTTPTLQVVVNPMVRRGSPMHHNIFKNLRALGADYVRFVPWLPYPKLGVAELEPPAGNPRCAVASDFQHLYIECPGFAISKINFADYGQVQGSCGNFQSGKCTSPNAIKIVSDKCLGKTTCSLSADPAIFGDPCVNQHKVLAIQAECYPSINSTSWDFTFIDPLMEDLMDATSGHSVIINFSTTPQWMWNTASRVDYPADPNTVTWGYEQGTELRDHTMKELADYYARLVGWYTNGGLVDEYGVTHKSGHFYDIPYWEILNEVEAEHSMSVEYYTKIYDAIASSILNVQPKMKFVGMAKASANQPNWYIYFLNSSNHAPGIPLDFISFHFYASPPSRTDIKGYEIFFSQADGFFEVVKNITIIRNSISPKTKIDIDELGVILPNDNDLIPVPIPDPYWNAAAAMYAYIFGTLALQGIDVLGESQLVGYPTQFPSVTELEWEHGNPTARYWVLKLLIDNIKVGDTFIQTSSSNPNIFASGILSGGQKKVLLVNKKYQSTTVSLSGIKSGTITFTDTTVGFNPPKTTQFSNGIVTLGNWSVAILTNLT